MAKITDHRKFTTKIKLVRISSFYFFTVRISLKSFPDLYTPYKKLPSQIFCEVRRWFTTWQITLTLLSRSSQSPWTIESRNTRPRLLQKVNSLCTAGNIQHFEPNTVLWAFRTIQPSCSVYSCTKFEVSMSTKIEKSMRNAENGVVYPV